MSKKDPHVVFARIIHLGCQEGESLFLRVVTGKDGLVSWNEVSRQYECWNVRSWKITFNFFKHNCMLL